MADDNALTSDDPRPDGHYHVEADSTWYDVDDDLARTVALGPATDGEPGDDWVFRFTSAVDVDGRDDRERVCVRLTPRALHELYIEAKDLSADARQAGHSGKCALCGEPVDLDERSLTAKVTRPTGTVGPTLMAPPSGSRSIDELPLPTVGLRCRELLPRRPIGLPPHCRVRPRTGSHPAFSRAAALPGVDGSRAVGGDRPDGP